MRSKSVASLVFLLVAFAGRLPAQDRPAESEAVAPRPVDATEATRRDPAALARLQAPGTVLFEDDFESEESLKKWFEIRGRDEGRARLVYDAALAHRGKGVFRFDARDRKGRASGSGASAWLGAAGHERVHFRRYIRFAKDYDPGHLHHVGGGLAGVATSGKWDAMGLAGRKPAGDDHFNSSFEPWRDWGREKAPGFMFLYTYWMDMERAPDGNFWGNMLMPAKEGRMNPPLDRWVCLEHMIRVNRVRRVGDGSSPSAGGEVARSKRAEPTALFDGELAAWIDGELYLHLTGLRWRSDEKVLIKRFDIGLYVHAAKRDDTVWYDDVKLSTGYVGPVRSSRR